ncbi:MAG TPA: riboflavin synthase [Pseudomonadales bacterium]
MFTGIIEALGTITAREAKGGDCRLQVASDTLDFADVKLGDSIATNGVCLTVTGLEGQRYWADVSNETLRLSTLADIQPGDRVNLEKAMQAGGRFGGHIVSGHVDGIGQVARLLNDGRSIKMRIDAPEALRRYIAHKGSITVDGISLTVNELEGNGFWLNIVPHTAQQTVIAGYRVGSRVNLEVDVIARYLEQLLHGSQAGGSKINEAFLAQHGFIK